MKMKKIITAVAVAFATALSVSAQVVPECVVNELSNEGNLQLVTSYVRCSDKEAPDVYLGFWYVRRAGEQGLLAINVRVPKTTGEIVEILEDEPLIITKMNGEVIRLPRMKGLSRDVVKKLPNGEYVHYVQESYLCRRIYGLFDGVNPAVGIEIGMFPKRYCVRYADDANPLNMAIIQAIDPIFSALEERGMYSPKEWVDFDD